jgi:hypothetical protein
MAEAAKRRVQFADEEEKKKAEKKKKMAEKPKPNL